MRLREAGLVGEHHGLDAIAEIEFAEQSVDARRRRRGAAELLQPLVRPLVTFHLKRVYRSGGGLELGRGFGGSALAPSGGFDLAPFALGGAVAVADVVD